MRHHKHVSWLGLCCMLLALAAGCPSKDEKSPGSGDGGNAQGAAHDAATDPTDDTKADAGDGQSGGGKDAGATNEGKDSSVAALDASDGTDRGDASTAASSGKGISGKVDGTQVNCDHFVAAGVSGLAVNVTGVQTDGSYPGMTITLAATGGVKAGTKYDCAGPSNNVTYTDAAATTYYANAATGSCEVTFSEIGDAIGKPLKGTFSATLKTVNGMQMVTITGGVVDTTLIGYSM